MVQPSLAEVACHKFMQSKRGLGRVCCIDLPHLLARLDGVAGLHWLYAIHNAQCLWIGRARQGLHAADLRDLDGRHHASCWRVIPIVGSYKVNFRCLTGDCDLSSA